MTAAPTRPFVLITDHDRVHAWRVAGWLWLLAGLSCPVVLALPGPALQPRWALLAIMAGAVCAGTLQLRCARRGGGPDWLLEPLVHLGNAAIVAGMVIEGGHQGPSKMYVFFCALYAAVFFRRPWRVLVTCWVAVLSPLLYDHQAVADGYLAELYIVLPALALLVLGVSRGKHELVALREQSDRRADTDPLTGLLNRRGLEQALPGSGDAGCVVLYVDIDRFKAINDELGHDHGDEILRQIATELRAVARRDDVLARLGGDEFVLILWDTTPADAQRAADRLRAAVSRRGALSISVGIAAVAGSSDPAAALRDADLAMLRAKRAGRDRVEHAA